MVIFTSFTISSTHQQTVVARRKPLQNHLLAPAFPTSTILRLASGHLGYKYHNLLHYVPYPPATKFWIGSSYYFLKMSSFWRILVLNAFLVNSSASGTLKSSPSCAENRSCLKRAFEPTVPALSLHMSSTGQGKAHRKICSADALAEPQPPLRAMETTRKADRIANNVVTLATE